MTSKIQNVICVIPAHMASVRFPGKILFPFFGYPMIEHVRRRAQLSKRISKVFVATCDSEIARVVTNFGGDVILTSDRHLNGTSRVAEATGELEASHIILLQGDEPLLLPQFIDQMVEAISNYPTGHAWNGTGPIEKKEDLDRHSFVKCATTTNDNILYCFRRSPSHAPLKQQQHFVRKILGIIAYRKEILESIVRLEPARIETIESIEQMRIIENGYNLTSVPLLESLPSVNEPEEADIVLRHIRQSAVQRELVRKTFGINVQ